MINEKSTQVWGWVTDLLWSHETGLENGRISTREEPVMALPRFYAAKEGHVVLLEHDIN